LLHVGLAAMIQKYGFIKRDWTKFPHRQICPSERQLQAEMLLAVLFLSFTEKWFPFLSG
jgi:hypothetical protein